MSQLVPRGAEPELLFISVRDLGGEVRETRRRRKRGERREEEREELEGWEQIDRVKGTSVDRYVDS